MRTALWANSLLTGKNTGNFMHFVCAFLKPVAVGASFCSAYALGANARLEIKQGIFRDVSGNLIRLSGNSCGRIREFLRRAFWPLRSAADERRLREWNGGLPNGSAKPGICFHQLDRGTR